MNSPVRLCWNSQRLIQAVLTLGLLGGSAAAGAAAEPGFPLRDFLGRTWRNECVQFPLAGAALRAAQAGKPLAGPDGTPVLYQIVAGANKDDARLAFLADLDPFENRVYRFVEKGSRPSTDLKLEEGAHVLRLSNRLTGIAIARALEGGAGPIAQVRLPSGKWIGASRLQSSRKLKSYRADVVTRGPVYAEVVCRAEFEDGKTWELRCRLQANEPVILVDETFALGDASTFVLAVGGDFAQQIYHRRAADTSDGRIGRNLLRKIANADGPVFSLDPWLRWWGDPNKGNWFGVCNDKAPDLLAIGCRAPAVWVEPFNKDLTPPWVPVVRTKDELQIRFALAGGRRQWTIQAHDRETALAALKAEQPITPPGGRGPTLPPPETPLPQVYLLKHADFPLDRVKDYVLDWPGDHDNYPRLFLSKADLAAHRKSFEADPKLLAQYRKAPLAGYNMDEPLRYYLGTGDAALGEHLAKTAAAWVQDTVQVYLRQSDQVTIGFAPHHHANLLFPAWNLADAVLGGPHLTPAAKTRLRAQIAFLGYLFERADMWSPERGYSANPNMTTTVNAFRLTTACLLPSHPRARAWAKQALAELKDRQLDTWSDANGGWLEAPHYAMVSYDYLAGGFLMARNAGFADHVHDPKMKNVIAWFAKISTPPDGRFKGLRHLPPIGNTYLGETTGGFGLAAFIWKDKDPAFAAQMQWMHQQQGSPQFPGIGGFYPTLAGYRTLLTAPEIAARAPAYESELFPETGVILRSGFPSSRETQLHLIAGRNHDHYDKDSGSITFSGRGRVLADDFGYTGHAPGDDHSMVVAPDAADIDNMHVSKFATTRNLDYVLGTKAAWNRRIAFIKDADPLAPNYFVIRDGLTGKSPGTWRLWLVAKKVALDGASATVEGTDDVDLDVFAVAPGAVSFSTEQKTRNCLSVLGSYMDTTQTGLVAPLKNGAELMVVLFPRLKTEKRPSITPLADNRGVKVESSAGIDYVFVSPQPFSWKEGALSFEGTVGTIQLRGKDVVLSLGDAGRITAGERTLESAKAVSQRWPVKP